MENAKISIDNFIKKNLPFFDMDNDNFRFGLSIALILYATIIAPNLPIGIARLFDNPLFNLLILFIVLYIGSHSPVIAVIAAIAIVVSLMKVQSYKMGRELMAVATLEGEMERRKILEESKDGTPTIYETADERYPDGRFYLPKQVTGYRPSQYMAPIIPQETPLAMSGNAGNVNMEEEKVNAVLSKVEETQAKLGRELSSEEIKNVSDKIIKNFNYLEGTCDDEFCIDNLSLLTCAGREPPAEGVSGYDSCVKYASPDLTNAGSDQPEKAVLGFDTCQKYTGAPLMQ